MEEFKDCKNCLHIKEESHKIYCEKGKFFKVPPQKFFYDPKTNPLFGGSFFISKYETVSHAIECDYYNSVKFILITDVDFRPVESDGARYGDINVSIERHTKSVLGENVRTGNVRYTNVSPNSKLRKYFEKVKAYIDVNKELSN